jgi:hypothetical protein
MILQRIDSNVFGVFGSLLSDDGAEICKTLEHAYPKIDSRGVSYFAKLPTGNFRCSRGLHRLRQGDPFDTFEVLDVPGHTGILFHPGNYNRDSDGCVLLGEAISDNALVRSAKAFSYFMRRLQYVDCFTLTVR